MKVRICPNCNKQNLENAFNCANCGTTLSVSTLVEVEFSQTEETPSSDNAKSATTHPHREQETRNISSSVKVGNFFCINCGVELPGESKFCWKCGAQVHNYSSKPQNTIVEHTVSNSVPAVGQTEFRSISCAMGSCNKPVIGQCKSCGRYYCANHNMGSLCSECGRKKSEQELFQDFLSTAENVMHEADKGYKLTKFAVSGWMGLLACMGAFMLLLSFTEGNFSNFLAMLVIVGIMVSMLFFTLKVQFSSRRRRALNKASLIEKSKPGFLAFYEAYDNRTFKEEISDTLNLGKRFFVSFAGNMAGSIARDEMEASRQAQLRNTISRAVDDELNRHGL